MRRFVRNKSEPPKRFDEDIGTADVALRTPEMEECLLNEPKESTDAFEKKDVTHISCLLFDLLLQLPGTVLLIGGALFY